MAELNLRQINIGNIEEKMYETSIVSIPFQTKNEKIYKNITYAKIKFGTEIDYGGSIIKYKPFILRLGYCCSPMALEIPIFLAFNGSDGSKPFYVKPNGMFEYMTEQFKDINSVDQEYEEQVIETIPIHCLVTMVEIPYKCEETPLPFTLDYVELLN